MAFRKSSGVRLTERTRASNRRDCSVERPRRLAEVVDLCLGNVAEWRQRVNAERRRGAGLQVAHEVGRAEPRRLPCDDPVGMCQSPTTSPSPHALRRVSAAAPTSTRSAGTHFTHHGDGVDGRSDGHVSP